MSVTGALLTIWIIFAIVNALSVRSFTWKAGLNLLASACIAIGGLGFFGTGLSATGELQWLSDTFEWPVGSAEGVLITSDGTHIVPHTDSGRIQIYDEDLNFLRGWSIDAAGGVFQLYPAGDGDFYIYTARGSRKYHYDIYGTLLTWENYSPGSYSRFAGAGHDVRIPTPFYLLVFSSTLYSWFVAVIGFGLLAIVRKLKKKEKDTAIITDT